MRFLRQNTAVRITVGPFFDKTDGVTPETSLTVTNCKLTFMVDDDDGTAANLIIDAAATASSGNNDMVHVTNDDAGFYDLELTAAQTNYVGRAMLAITDAANHCPVFHEFMILPANVYDALMGTDKLYVDVSELSSDATAADNAESFFDGTGYAGTNNVIPTVTTTGTATNLTNLPATAATAAELAKVPKSDSNVSWNATALAAINAEVDTALNTAIPGSPTSDSINERVKTLDDHITADYSATEKAAVDLLDDAYTGTMHAAIADAIWEEAKSGHTTATTFGDLGQEAFTLADDAISSDKYDESTAFPLKSQDASTTILARAGDKMDIVNAPNSTGILAIVDAFLTRAFGSVTYTGTTRCVLTALQKLRNKVANSAGTLTVYKEDDSTSSYTETVTTSESAEPIISTDPD